MIKRLGLGLLFIVAFHAGFALAAAVSMLDEDHGIRCKFPNGDRMEIDARETSLTVFRGKSTTEFVADRFLDSAFLVKGKTDPEQRALFQIFPNGTATLTEGRSFDFFEKNCDDTGASKTCHWEGVKRFFWSPEALELDAPPLKIKARVESYGILANHATYFSAREKDHGLSIVDFGSPLTLVAGRTSPVSCEHF